ncbi:MAG TPA: HAMP domain-containing sensor histidine kinase [Candidatus Angelobacter sp.]|nr:HAMP domain-containing sensor histidine kinase [Candidatus Angelobacter sp.]
MPLREWLKPPKSLLIVLFLLTMVAVSSLSWLGWRLLQQERAVADQRTQEQLERTADQVVANLRGTLAEARERLSAWPITPPPDGQPDHGVLLVGHQDFFLPFPNGRLLYWPAPSQEPQAPPDVFAEGERHEFVQQQEAQAAEWYRRLADFHSPVPVRAGALMRLGRVLTKLGRKKESAAVYAQLSLLNGVTVAGAPAELVARHELCELLGRPADAELLKTDLLLGRWRLSRGQFEFYWSEAVRLSGHNDSPPSDSIALADAATAAWQETTAQTAPHGERSLWADGKPFLVIWRDDTGGRLALISPVAWMLPQTPQSENVYWALVDNDGKVVAGRRDGTGRAAIRTAAEGQLPWTLYVTGLHSSPDAGPLAQKRFVLVAVTIVVVFLLAGSYFITRAIRRESEVSQLQANFVAAVSHEFRSPLTSMRQLSEILAQGRVPNDERRHVYYETLVSETGRLQRLVETLLDFGRMEAGVRHYQLQTLEVAHLARQVTAEFEQEIAASGRHIELSGPAERCAIQADPEALSVALRNLVDNALKYSPDCPGVWVEWKREDGYVAIRVRDQGAGIAVGERKAIFRKFVRGSAAITGKVKGTGVGLTIACQIVAAHHGEIRVVSEPGHGSTFTLLFPAVETVVTI